MSSASSGVRPEELGSRPDMVEINRPAWAGNDESFKSDRFNLHPRFRLQPKTSMCIMEPKFTVV
jgi:hypothetical protein